MDTFDAILNRRSIRKYTNKPIPEKTTNDLLKAAMYAPSAMNYQPWQFVVVKERDNIDEIFKVINHAEMLKSAQVAVLICGDLNIEKNVDFLQQNCSAATQNLMLWAYAAGLGSCWISVYPGQEVITGLKNLFNLPESIIPISLVSLGYPAENPIADERYKIEKVHFNQW